jgi:hypothetical protein
VTLLLQRVEVRRPPAPALREAVASRGGETVHSRS